ncbi:hypothetical protein [Ferrimonas sp. SCSIO 43195]|uniref:hypothetical protein n=1 Tax=Ferrimonas sp. SCSIO 43195 TaxID=2822844 RepID=UPI0020754C64|nr:hypothetical protein [Ferrimonas sp. SCSIO 43195]USD39496.1 hypothetical protein J8Z22_10625 [Ferrimonas sp. SCSIO 43195]
MKSELIELANEMRSIFEQARKECVALFVGSFRFPNRGCEGACRYFAHRVMTQYPECRVSVVEGYDRRSDERHFWVVVDDRVYDLTCDRFEGVSAPILGEQDTPLSQRFKELKFIEGGAIFDNWNPGERFQKARVLRYIHYKSAQPHLYLVKC